MRVLHILDHSLPLHSGYTFRTLSLLRESRAMGIETFHVTSPKQGTPPDVRDETVDGWHFYRTPMSPGLVTDMPALGEIELLGELTHRVEYLARTLKPHVIHAHSPVLNALPALRVGRRLQLPVVYEVRALWEDAAVDHGSARAGGVRYRLTRALETHAARRANHLVTICEGLKSEFMSRGIPASKISVVPNGVDIERFGMSSSDGDRLRGELGLQSGVVLGFVGSFYGYEGLHLLIQALPAIQRELPDVRVLLVGGGFQEDALKRQVVDMGLEKIVRFTGRVPHEQVQSYYDVIDILVYPRLSMRLTEMVTPLKPLEAMAQGRLVAASDIGGHREMMKDGVTATLFKAGDASDLAEKVLQLAKSRTRWPEMRSAARAYVEAERNWAACVRPYLTIYEALTGEQLKCA
jgi:PEP-CTERM/exosortase A-associated glycosyltransferase